MGKLLIIKVSDGARAIALWVSGFVALFAPSSATAWDWDVVKYRERDYVKAAELAEFYKFNKAESGVKSPFPRQPSTCVR